MNSINTNASSLLGVQSFTSNANALDKSRSEISSGRKINGPEDNAAILSIAQILESDIGGLNSVKASLDNAISSSDVALAASTEVSDLLIQLKEKAVEASDPGLDDSSRLALNSDFVALRDQITDIVNNAEFNGKNVLKSGGDDITALVGAEGDGTVTIEAQDLSLGGANITLSASQQITTQADAQAAVAAIEQSIENVGEAISVIGSGSTQLIETKEFTELLQAKTQEGLGNLVDTDLAAASAGFAANQIREALSVQSLSISNQQPAILLSLFQQD